jgi:hypothetical protein
MVWRKSGEHHFRDAGFEMALSEMAGDADQAVLLPIPRKGNAIIRPESPADIP